MARSQAYEKYPEHTLVFDAEPAALRVRVGDVVVAETRAGLRLIEGRYPPVVYVPREDVRMEHLARTSHSTHCPFKGDASYYDFQGESETISQLAWSYEDPFDQMAAIRDHLAFYPDRAEIESIDHEA